MENACVKYGEHMLHPDPKKPGTCIRCGKPIDSAIWSDEEIAEARRESTTRIVQDNIELYEKAERMAKQSGRDALEVYEELHATKME